MLPLLKPCPTLPKPLAAARADAFVVPMILGSVGQLVAEVSNARPPGVITTSEHKGGAGGATRSLTLTLIARRGLDRAGTRHWRRGADSKVCWCVHMCVHMCDCLLV